MGTISPVKLKVLAAPIMWTISESNPVLIIGLIGLAEKKQHSRDVRPMGHATNISVTHKMSYKRHGVR